MLEVLDRLRQQHRPAEPGEQALLARWSGWGSLPKLFDEADDSYAVHRERARRLLGDDGSWEAARRSTLNAHYTSAEVIKAMWRAVGDLGFAGGRVLEPGCGSGNFIGLAPDGCDITGIEADPTTAAIARHLYGGRSEVLHRRFESFLVPDGHFDLVIGNVPFAKVTPHDPRHNRSRHALHNYFIVKSLHLTRPGGLVAVLTSRYTLDSRNPSARREIDGVADLVGAIRLPAKAFLESSGTEVVCDVVVLRRRDAGTENAGAAWARADPAPLGDEGEALHVNQYLLDHPDRVLGTLGVHRGMYRERELTVEASGPLAPALDRALDSLVADARQRGLTVSPRSAPLVPPAATTLEADERGHRFAQEGSFLVVAGRLARVRDGRAVPHRPRYASEEPELRRLIRLRDAGRAVLAAQVSGVSDAELEVLQRDLAAVYDTYRHAHGPLNRFRAARTGRVDPDTGEEVRRRIRPRMGGFRDDPDWPLVAALEVFDDETQRSRPAAMFSERIISPPIRRLGVDSGAEAVAVCLDEKGALALPRIAELLGTDEESARAELGGLVWEDPENGALVPASTYLSGNVRNKLEVARATAANDPRWEANVAALRAVLPRQLGPGEIGAGLGAPWIPASDVESFCSEVLGAEVEVERVAALGRWAVALRTGRRVSVSLSSEWGTPRADAVTLLDASLNQRLHTVWNETEDRRRVRNDAQTIAARDKQDALAARFAAWLWEDPERGGRLSERYNELFNSVVVPAHDGGHLSLPGLAETFRPHPHQRDAVARILTDGRALLAHAVGAGKTATMVIAAMELRRLGLASKPAVVVPNHMLDQFTREWLQLYPSAKVLVADRDRLSKERRKEFVARCATGDWDAVIFTHSGFGRLPLGGELLNGYMGEELVRCREALSQSRDGKGLSVKRLERRIAQLEESYKRLAAAELKDDGVRFEETGVDYLFVDEAHLFKNRRVDSAIEGAGNPGSQRAQDLDAKLWALRRLHGTRVVTFATATPVANSIAELWTMQSYLQPDVLAAVDLAPFDSWAATFGRTVTALELAPDGASYRMKTRFARFSNIPELLALYRQVADVRTSEDLKLPVPDLRGGQPETVVVPASETLREYVVDLASRAERVRSRAVAPDEDNMLKITGDGRRAALDLRLVGESPDPSGGKLAVAAERIAAIHRSSRENRYLDPYGEPHPRPGAVQLVFCDVSTPAGSGWNAYDELKALLCLRGVPPDAVRFVHEAGTDEAKAKLFAACRDGQVAVLIGSTDKMGIGTNVQARAVALHHLDCPWRPADIEQRDGRIVRQGNQNAEVSILRYVTEGSFDTFMWQTVERKAAFINQVATGRAVDRDVDDIGDQALSYAEVKALATGNPLILEKAAVDADVARLGRLRRAHLDDQHRLRGALDAAERRVGTADRRISQLEAAIASRTDTRGERFEMTIGGTRYDKRVDAGQHLHAVIARHLSGRALEADPDASGRLAGLDFSTVVDRRFGEVCLSVPEAGVEVRFDARDWAAVDTAHLVQRLERRIQNLDASLAEARDEKSGAASEAERAGSRIGAPFEHESQLRGLLRRQQEINQELIVADGAEPVEQSHAERMAARLAVPPAGRAPSSLSL